MFTMCHYNREQTTTTTTTTTKQRSEPPLIAVLEKVFKVQA